MLSCRRHKYNARAISLNLFTTACNTGGVQIDCHPADDTKNNARAISLNLFITACNTGGVQIYCYPADGTGELGDRNFFSSSVMSMVVYLHMLSCCAINVCGLLVYTVDLRCPQRKKV